MKEAHICARALCRREPSVNVDIGTSSDVVLNVRFDKNF
jgi:hypothetical protein